MKIQVSKLQPNPFRRMDEYPIDREKVESLKSSIKDTSFWDNILARKSNGQFQIAYGHHRLVALKALKVKEVDIPVRDLDDGMMIKIMANENRDTYKANRAVMVETVRVARDWLREQMGKGWDNSDKSIRVLFEGKHAYDVAKGMGVGRDLIKKFLNGDWKEWEIQESLAQLDDTEVSPKALSHFEKLTVAREARDAFKRFDVPKSKQESIARTLVKTETPRIEIRQKVAEIAKAQGWTKPAPATSTLPDMPPMLDARIDEIIGDIGALSGKLAKVKGHLSFIQNKRLRESLITQAKVLQGYLEEVLRKMEDNDGNSLQTSGRLIG